MGADTPLHFGALVVFGAFTAAGIAAIVRHLLKSKSFSHPNPGFLDLTIGLVFFISLAAVLSFLLFNALHFGEAYGFGGGNGGIVHSISQEPGIYWFWTAVYYGLAVAALSAGLAVGARFLQPRRTLSEAERMKEDSDSEREMRGVRYKRYELLWRNANISFFALWVALCMYLGNSGRMPVPGYWVFACGGLLFVSSGLFAIYTGETNDAPHYRRSKSPGMFWFDAGMQLFLGTCILVGSILAGIVAVVRAFGKG